MKIIITEEQKKKLFVPRRLSGEDSRWAIWNKEQPYITIDDQTLKINQYDLNGKKIGLWVENPETIERLYIKTKPFMKNIFDNLEVFKKPNYTNYMIGDDIYFHDPKNEFLWVSYRKIWSILIEQYSLKGSQIQELIKIWMEITYKLGSLTPIFRWKF